MISAPTNVGSDNTVNSNKILWLSIIQGYAILLVLIGHVNGFTYNAESEMYPLSEAIHRFCYSFHMPLFMFVSGGLLYLTRINRGWKTPALYIDKLKRLLLPYIVFTAIAFLIKIPFTAVAKSGSDVSWIGFVNALFSPVTGPLKEMWFIGTLLWLMLMYPLYKTMLKYPLTEAILLCITLIPFIFGVHINIDGWFNVAGVSRYAFYFVAGMLFFKYNVVAIFERHVWSVIVVTAIYIILFTIDAGDNMDILTAVFGILMSFGIGVRVARRIPRLFASFRDHSFQIFLVGIFPQMFIELVVWQRLHHEALVIPYYIVSVMAAMVCGVMMSKYGARIRMKGVRWCLGLK